MEKLKHFSHAHSLHLVHMQLNQENENSDEEDEEEMEDEDEDEFVESFGECNMCREPIYTFQLCYYKCKECDYYLHKFCAELPKTLEKHPLHPSHNIVCFTNNHDGVKMICNVCRCKQSMYFFYYCDICEFRMDIVCATISKQKMDHPSHPHQLQRLLKLIVSICDACGDEQKGTFYHCTTCSQFMIHQDCAFLPKKLRIEQTTSGTLTHFHPLTLAYSFPYLEQQARFHPRCRVCGKAFEEVLWRYKCDKCWYYTHVDCAISKKDIFSSASVGKTTSKSLEDNDHPNLLRLPFHDESDNLLKHHFFNQKDPLLINETNDGEILKHASHPEHPLILFDTNLSLAAAADKSISLHDPMTRNQLLCDGCIRPITTVPFYKCSQDAADHQCGFALHKWCAQLPESIHDHPGHPEHTTLSLMPTVPNKLFGVFECRICRLPSNGFAYGCRACEYYVDINCAFIPSEITHEAHPNHLLSRINPSAMPYRRYCNACKFTMRYRSLGFQCRSCDFIVHIECALLLPRMIRHKSDKQHPLNLRYVPVENHMSEYFCEICEDGLDPNNWFYHCSICDQSMHTACAPIILENEQSTYYWYGRCVFRYMNVKFGASKMMDDHHPHRLTFVQGIHSDGRCVRCHYRLQYKMILKCMECAFAIHYDCVRP